MEADLYVVYKVDWDESYEEATMPIIATKDKKLAEIISKEYDGHCEIRKYSDMTNITNPCSMAYYDKMEHEKNLIIKELKEEQEQKDKRIHSLNETIVRLTNIRGE